MQTHSETVTQVESIGRCDMARNPDRKEDRVIFKVIRGEVNAFMPDSEANPGMILC